MQDPFLTRYPTTRRKPDNRADMFKELDATELYCPLCACATPVRKRLLLVLPEGDKYEYLCSYCMTSVGTKIVRKSTATENRILV
jgi:hypothetical protein